MKPILGIAKIQLILLWRSNGARAMALILLLWTLAMPFGIKTDGTINSYVALHLTYTIGLATFWLSLLTLWHGCASIGREIETKTLYQVVLKPLSFIQIWIGKWLALVLMNALLLTLTGIISYATLNTRLRQGAAEGVFTEADMTHIRQTTLGAFRPNHATLPDVEADIQAAYRHMADNSQLPDDMTEPQIRAALRKNILTRHFRIVPDGRVTWHFAWPPPGAGGAMQIQTRCDFSTPGYASQPITYSFQYTTADGGTNASPAFTTNVLNSALQTHVFPELPEGITGMDVSIHNLSQSHITLFFDPESGVVLRVAAGTFLKNYVYAMLQLLARLSLFAAIGIMAGALFSLPVATFITLALLLLLQLSHFVSAAAQLDRNAFVANVTSMHNGHSHGETDDGEEAPSLISHALANATFYIYRGTWLALQPLWENRTMEHLTTGTEIPLARVVKDFVVQCLIYPVALAMLSLLLFRRRELGGTP